MSDPSSTIDQNILPVQALFDAQNNFQTFIGQGQPFYASVDPAQSGLNITNSTINSTTIGATTPSSAAFTTATVSTAPTSSIDVANKQYVDGYVAGLSWKPPVNYGTTGDITLSGLATQGGGDWASALTAGMRVLVKNQSTQANNGIYVAAAGAWSRSVDADLWDELISAICFIESGNTLGGSAWYCPAQPGGTLGTTAITWSNFSVAATYSAGTGLTLSSYQFSITNTGVAAATYGSASSVPVYTVNAQGQLTSATNTSIAINANQITSGSVTNAQLQNSSFTLNGTAVSLGGTSTITAANPNALTFGTGMNTGSYDGSSAQTISLADSGVTAATYGSASSVPVFAVNAKGQVTGVTNTSIAIANTAVSGLGTMSTQNANAVAITGGTITSTTLTSNTVSNNLQFTPTTAPTYAEGVVFYDSTAHTLNYYNENSQMSVNIGQEQIVRVRNQTGAQINNGTVVYVNGATGNTPTIAKAIATSFATSDIIGVATTDIADNGFGYVTISGLVNGIDTSAFTDGQAVFLSPTVAGTFTTTEPSNPNYSVQVGVITRANPSNGTLLVSVQFISTEVSHIVGTLPIASGGTNTTTAPTAGAVAYGTGSAYAFSGVGTSGQVLTSNGTSAPTWTTPAAYATVTDDTTTNATRYILFANQTTGNLSTEYVSSTKLKYNPSTGALTASQLIIAP